MNIALLSSLTILAALLSGCGGGQSASTPPLAAMDPGRTAYALDDYVVGGTANIYRLGTGTLLYSTTTGEKGAFSWPASLTGDVRVEVVGGHEDTDGLNTTSADRTAFSGTLSAVFNADQPTGSVLLSAVSTGLTLAAGASVSQYNSLKEALPADVQFSFFLNASDSPTSIQQKLTTALAIQRAAGFSSLVSELADDGLLNSSTGMSAASVSISIASATSTAPISVMSDLALQYCVASAIGKEPSLVTQDDLATVTQLYCNDSGVLSINGIGALANLESLFLDKNDIADATPIKTLAKLSYITLADNRLASIDDLKAGAYAGLAIDVEGNCITNASSLVDSPALKVTWFTKVPARQYPGCNKNDADVRRITAKLSPSGAFVLTYNTTLNPIAQCTIRWSDGSIEAALCDGKSHTIQHGIIDSTVEVTASIVINGAVKASKSLGGRSSTPLPPVRLSGGNNHSLAVAADGSLFVWGGKNSQPWAGNSTVGPKLLDSGVSGGSIRIEVALWVKADGSLWAAGRNAFGQLGDGTTIDSQLPKRVGVGYAAVSVGGTHSLGLKSDGSLWAWGNGSAGQIGDGTRLGSVSPKQIGTGYIEVSAGEWFSLGLKADGTIWTWGASNIGPNSSGNPFLSPTMIGAGFIAVSSGAFHSLGLKADGSLWAWGDNGFGQLGDGTTARSENPKQIGIGYTAISAGFSHALGVKADGSLWAWGQNGSGQLGDGTTIQSLVPKQIGSGYRTVGAGIYQSLATKTDGTLWSWGDNSQGQLGDGKSVNLLVPTQIGTGF